MPDYGEKIEGGFYDDSRHLYRDERGTIISSTTQVFDVLAMVDYSAVDPERVQWKAGYGVALHRCIELIVSGSLDWDSVDPILVPAVEAIDLWLKAVEYQPIACEEIRIATINGMKYGMKLDLRGSLLYRGQRRPVILDLKTCSKPSPCWPWQIGAYANGSPSPGGMYVGVDLQVTVAGKVTPHWVPDVLKATREFGLLLACANLKINAGLAKIKNVEED